MNPPSLVVSAAAKSFKISSHTLVSFDGFAMHVAIGSLVAFSGPSAKKEPKEMTSHDFVLLQGPAS